MTSTDQNWQDILLLVLSILLGLSECLPFVQKIKANGILHAVSTTVKDISEYSRSKREGSEIKTPQE